jgi:hypothetical protein
MRRGGGGRRVPELLIGAIVMIIIGLFLNFAVLAALCWGVFNLAIYALPAFVGTSAFLAVQAAGQGEAVAVVGGLLAGGATWGIGKTAFALTRSVALRLFIALAFAAPAAIAGYHLLYGFSAFGTPSDIWRQVIGVIGSVSIGATAFARLVSDPASAMQAGGAGR